MARTKTAQTAEAEVVDNIEETKEVVDVQEQSLEDEATTEAITKEEVVEDVPETQSGSEIVEPEVEAEVEEEETPISYPYNLTFTTATTLYKKSEAGSVGKPFVGAVTVLAGPDANGFSPVNYMKSGFGLVRGYMIISEGKDK